MSDEQVRLGLIGAGRIAQAAHLPAAEKAAGVAIVAVTDPNEFIAHGVAARYGLDHYPDSSALLAADLDGVIIAAPDRFHLPLAAAALRAGKHVLVEKPLAANTAEAVELNALAVATGLKLQVGSMKRHDPGIQFAKAVLPRVGRVLSARVWYRVMAALRPEVEATLFRPTIMDPAVRMSENQFKADRERYLLTTHGAHVFDGLRHLAGDVTSIAARVATVGGDYSWHGTGRLAESGGLVSFEITVNVHSTWSEGVEIFGERGQLAINTHFPFLRLPSDVRLFLEQDSTAVVPAFGDSDAYERQLEGFAAAITTDSEPNPDGHDGLEALRLLEAVAASATADGREVVL